MNVDKQEKVEKKKSGKKRGLDQKSEATLKALEVLKTKKAKPDTTTEKGAPAFSTTKSARLDLFFGGLVRGAAEDKVTQLFAAAWKENPEHAVQLMQHARDCRGGKGEKAVSLMCLMWLRKNKPATYLLNLENFLSNGYYKDLCAIALAVHQQSLPLLGQQECFELELFAEQLKRDFEALQKLQALRLAKADADEKAEAKKGDKGKPKDKAKEAEKQTEKEGDEEWEKVDGMDTSEDHKDKDKQKDGKEGKGGKEEKKGDAKEQPKQKTEKKRIEISLAAKWAPGEKTSFDKKGNLAKRLAKLLFPNDKTAMKSYRALIGQLRAELKVVERFMCGGEWEAINFSHVPSRAHKLLKKAFQKHQPERYSQYLAALKSGKDPKVKINTATLHPHELVAPYLSAGGHDLTTEAQWTDMIAKLKAKGCFDSALAVCDVSGSMSGEPLQVAVSLGLVISEMTKAPFGGRIITFSSTPSWHIVQGETLFDKVQCVARAHWEQSTNLIGTFQLILDAAVQNAVPPQDMPKTLFILSDMQFDVASADARAWETTYNTITRMYSEKNYTPPNIVFWQLRGAAASAFPVQMDQKGVALVSGFSAQILKIFLDGKDLDPLSVMLAAIGEYPAEIDPSEA